ncbi:AraC family ligand binding domain-containing protein [Cronobacter sakazakii]
MAVLRRSGAIRETPLHQHARGQLLGAEQGLLTVDAGNARWVVPATHAVWIPPATPHGLCSHGPYSGWNVYIAAAACDALPDAPLYSHPFRPVKRGGDTRGNLEGKSSYSIAATARWRHS